MAFCDAESTAWTSGRRRGEENRQGGLQGSKRPPFPSFTSPRNTRKRRCAEELVDTQWLSVSLIPTWPRPRPTDVQLLWQVPSTAHALPGLQSASLLQPLRHDIRAASQA